MKPFAPVDVPKEEINRLCTEYLKSYRAGDKVLVQAFGENNPDIKVAIKKMVTDSVSKNIYRNDVYQVAVRDFDNGLVHLSIRRIDRMSCHDWRDFQEIKNMLVGAECEAVELYPAESRVVDAANQYHLWVMKDPAFRFPVGFNPPEALKGESSVAGSSQRSFDEGSSQAA